MSLRTHAAPLHIACFDAGHSDTQPDKLCPGHRPIIIIRCGGTQLSCKVPNPAVKQTTLRPHHLAMVPLQSMYRTATAACLLMYHQVRVLSLQ